MGIRAKIIREKLSTYVNKVLVASSDWGNKKNKSKE